MTAGGSWPRHLPPGPLLKALYPPCFRSDSRRLRAPSFVLFGRIADAPVGVDADAIAHRAAEQSVDGNTMMFAGNVPQCLVDARQCRHEHVATAEKGGAVDVLPVVLDAQRIFADEVLADLVDGRRRAVRAAFEGRFPPANEAGVRRDLDETDSRFRKELIDAGNFHGGLPGCLTSARLRGARFL